MPVGGTFTTLYANLITAPGTGNSVVYTLRINGASPSGGPTCTISGTATSCSDTSHTAAFSAGAMCDVQVNPGSTTSGAKPSAGLVFTTP